MGRLDEQGRGCSTTPSLTRQPIYILLNPLENASAPGVKQADSQQENKQDYLKNGK